LKNPELLKGHFQGVIFRRNATHVRNPGGLLDESYKIYPYFSGHCTGQTLEWAFKDYPLTMKFAHLEHTKTVLDWQGSQIAYIGLDELTHFEEEQFWYLLSRNRTTCGVPPYIRATTNPDAESWVRNLIDWWIGPDGLPIKERAGKLRWFVRMDSGLIWGDSKDDAVFEELRKDYPVDPVTGLSPIIPLSLTFIPSLLSDNVVLSKADPTYRAKLLAMPKVERERLLLGNWNSKLGGGTMFQRGYFPLIDHVQNTRVIRTIRYWDRAATKPNDANPNPDWTVGVKLGVLESGGWVVLDVARIRDTPLKVERLVLNLAMQDGYDCWIGLEQDPGSAGVADVDNMVRKLAGFAIRICKPTQDKITRAMPVSAQSEAGAISVIRAHWNNSFFTELESFPSDNSHDDIVDAFSGAFNELTQGLSILDVL
jgi:predicted phage terminase large subunit-like protein